MKKFKLISQKLKHILYTEQPEWKIQVGFYKTKLEADRALLNLKENIRSAIVIPSRK